MPNTSRRLNIFFDETGEFGFDKGSAKHYGVSLAAHEHCHNIDGDLEVLSRKFRDLEFDGMVHMGDLVAGHEDFEGMDPEKRKKIYLALFHFSKRVKAKYQTFIVEKKEAPTQEKLSIRIENKLTEFVVDNLEYLQSFDNIVVYYDGGQIQLSRIIDKIFGRFSSYERRTKFDKKDKKLFQVADMLTYVDKVLYKYSHKQQLGNTEKRFFSLKEIKRTARALKPHRFK